MLNWVFGKKVRYWMQTLRLPKTTPRRLRSIGYHLIWDGRKGACWDWITKAKKADGLGVYDFMAMDEAAMIKDVTKNKGSTWVAWMNVRYVKSKALDEIKLRQIDSSDWKAVLRHRVKVRKCVELGGGNSIFSLEGSG